MNFLDRWKPDLDVGAKVLVEPGRAGSLRTDAKKIGKPSPCILLFHLIV
jgi:hypothetical protein